MEELQVKILEWLALYGTKVVGAILILIIGRIVSGMLAKLVGRLLRRSKIDEVSISIPYPQQDIHLHRIATG